MRRGLTYSALMHLAVFLLAYLGLPHLMKPPVAIDEPIPVEIATIADKTTPPKLEPKPEPKPEPPRKAEPLPPAPPLPEPPKPEPRKVETPPPPVPPKPEPPQLAAVQPVVEPEPTPKPKPERKPEPEPQPVQAPTPMVPNPPKAKPKPPPDTTLDSILKSVEKIKPRPEPDQAEKVIKDLARATPRVTSSLDSKMTISEIDAVKRQIERCWNVPAGAKDAKNLVVDIHVLLNPDGSVREARIVDQARMQSDSFFQAAADSARRAIYLCQPLRLPPEKYSLWQEMTLSFNPSQII